MEAFADVVRAGKALYIGVSEWTPDQLRAGHALARELRIPFVSNQPQYSALYRVIEAEVVPTCRELGISQVVFSPIAQGVLTGKYQPGQPVPEGSRATDPDGSAFIKNLLTDDTLTRVQQLQPLAEAEGLTMAQLAVAWVLQNDNVATAITGGSRPEQIDRERGGRREEAVAGDAGRHRRRPGRRRPARRGGRGKCVADAATDLIAETETGDGLTLGRRRDPSDQHTLHTQGEAETWLGSSTPTCVEAGVRAVSLYEEHRLVYGPMRLDPE